MLPVFSVVYDSAPAFTPVEYDLDSGSTSLEIPTGATGYEIWVLGGGGGGGDAIGSNGGGGGGGGCAYRSGSVLSGEWGAFLTRSVGAAGSNETSQSANDAAAGGNSTLTGTLGGSAISMTGNGGSATNTGTGGTGGTASGGSSNTSGGAGGIGAPGVGGTPGVDLGDGRGTGGGGENSSAPVGGRIRVSFT